jgi:hypothetical protein
MDVRQARCCCGAVIAETTGEPVFNAICHCDNCKRRTGSAFGWSCYFRDEDFREAEGEAGAYVFESASGRQERRFCPHCGSTVYWRSAIFPGLVGVAGGAFPPGKVGEPVMSASENGRCAWLGLPDAWQHVP